MNGLAPRFDIRQTLAKDEKIGVHFEIEREGLCLTFDLSEAEALAVALAILDVSNSNPRRVEHLVAATPCTAWAEVIPHKQVSS